MENPIRKQLQELSRETLMEMIQVYSRNWLTVDGLWFSGVEEKYGLEAALELDIRMWQIGSLIEAKRIKSLLCLERGGIKEILRCIDFMSWAPSFGYEHTISHDRAIWTCTHCPPQEQRIKLQKGEFACKPTFDACFKNVIQVIDPRVRLRCIFCPPDSHPDHAWCQWEFTLPEQDQ